MKKKNLIYLAAATAMVASVGAASLFYFAYMLSSDNNAPIVIDAAGLQQQKVVRYSDKTSVDGATPGEAFLAALKVLESDFENLADEVDRTEKRLRDADSVLDAALDSPRTATIEHVSDHAPDVYVLESYYATADKIAGSFETNSQYDSATKAKVSPVVKELTRSFYFSRIRGEENHDKLQDLVGSATPDPIASWLMLSKPGIDSDERFRSWNQTLELARENQTETLFDFEVHVTGLGFQEKLSGFEFTDLLLTTYDLLFEAVAEYIEEPLILSYLYWRHEQLLPSMNRAMRGEILQRACNLPEDQFPRWLTHRFAASFAHVIARHHRGTKFMSEVAPADLDHFRVWSLIRGKHLMKAWCLQPDAESLSSTLLSHENWSSTTFRTEYEWFRHAVATNPDSIIPYSNLANSLLPRWGGSTGELTAMAQKCVQRVDDNCPIPFFGVVFLKQLLDEQTLAEPLKDDSLNSLAKMVAEHANRFPQDRLEYTLEWQLFPALARILWDHSEYEALRTLMIAGPSIPQSSFLAEFHLSMPLLQSYVALDPKEVAASTVQRWIGLQRKLFTDSDELERDQIKLCLAELGQISELNRGDTQVAYRAMLQVATWLDTFDRGETVALSKNGNEALWVGQDVEFEWIPDGFRVTSETDNHLAQVVPLIRFSQPFRVDVTFSVEDKLPDPFGLALFVGPHQLRMTDFDDYNGMAIRFAREDQDIPTANFVLTDRIPDNSFGLIGNSLKIFTVGETPSARCRADVFSDRIDAYVNDTKKTSMVEPIKTAGIVHFGRFCLAHTVDRGQVSSYTATNIEVRKLDEPESNPAE